MRAERNPSPLGLSFSDTYTVTASTGNDEKLRSDSSKPSKSNRTSGAICRQDDRDIDSIVQEALQPTPADFGIGNGRDTRFRSQIKSVLETFKVRYRRNSMKLSEEPRRVLMSCECRYLKTHLSLNLFLFSFSDPRLPVLISVCVHKSEVVTTTMSATSDEIGKETIYQHRVFTNGKLNVIAVPFLFVLPFPLDCIGTEWVQTFRGQLIGDQLVFG